MGFYAPNSLGQPGGFDRNRAQLTNDALRNIFGEQSYEIEKKRLGKLALIRCAEVEAQDTDEEFLLVERVLTTGLLQKRRSNSFEVTFDKPSEESEAIVLRTDFRYLPYRDGLGVHRSLIDPNAVLNPEEEEQANTERLYELMTGFGAGTENDWSEFKTIIDTMKSGIVHPVSAKELYGRQ